MTTKNQQHRAEAEAELIDLPDEERVTPSICSPKIFIITLLAAYFVSQNIYHYIMNPPKPVDPSLPEPDNWENFWELYDRFKLYLVVSVVGFIVFYFLRQSNDNAEFERYEAIRKQQEQQEEKRRKIQSERQQKILRQLQEQERVASQKQFNAARKFAQQYAAQAKIQKKPKQIDIRLQEEQNRKED